MTKTPVPPVTNPVVKPAIGDSQRCKGAEIDSGGARRQNNAYAKSAVPSPIVAHCVLSLVRSLDPTRVPITMPSIMSHNLENNATTFGPVRSCQTLVTKDGIITSDAAVAGGMRAPSTPIATVGSPIPVMPFTIPARVKTAMIIDICGAENSDTTVHSKCRSRGRVATKRLVAACCGSSSLTMVYPLEGFLQYVRYVPSFRMQRRPEGRRTSVAH